MPSTTLDDLIGDQVQQTPNRRDLVIVPTPGRRLGCWWVCWWVCWWSRLGSGAQMVAWFWHGSFLGERGGRAKPKLPTARGSGRSPGRRHLPAGPKGRPEFVEKLLPTDLTSTDTTERNAGMLLARVPLVASLSTGLLALAPRRPCRLRIHRWQRLRNPEGGWYRECRSCQEQQDLEDMPMVFPSPRPLGGAATRDAPAVALGGPGRRRRSGRWPGSWCAPSCCLARRAALPLDPGDGGHRGMPREHRGQAVEPTKSAPPGSELPTCRSAQGPGWWWSACGWGSGMPAPSGQIPPPWAWRENEAPAARAARGPSQATATTRRAGMVAP
jgi:hypothetical protein